MTSIHDLLLDPENPRLPEELQGGSQSAIWEYFYDNAVLNELEESMLENGFFSHEPLIILPPNPDGKHIVVEGNRRLAALLHLHEVAGTEESPLAYEPTSEQLEQLLEVPVFEVPSREEVGKFLGFRHIGGIKPWSPEAKARYLAKQVDDAHADGAENPFSHVARRVGSNTQGIRNFYVALHTLRHARDEGKIDIGYVLRERFTVWLRCMNSADIRSFIGLGSTKTYEEVREVMSGLEEGKLGEVIADLTPQRGSRKAVLSDSRDVTQYGMVLQNEQAHILLREYRDLNLARTVILNETLTKRVEDAIRRVESIKVEVERGSPNINAELQETAERLLKAVRLLQSSINVLAEE